MDSKKIYRVLTERCKGYDVISFDVFDTLLKRDVMFPTEVFDFVENNLNQKYGFHSCFAKKRVYTEYNLRKLNGLREVTLDEIYEEIDLLLEQKSVFKRGELEAEKQLLHANYPIKKVFDFCIKQKKKVYLISDMYLPLFFLTDILHKAGYSNYQKLYLSCEYRKTKRTGELFRIFLQEEGINPKSVLHIGDSVYADVLGAKRAGIKSFYIPKRINHTLYRSISKKDADLSQHALYAFVNNHEVNCRTRAEKLGYELIGPLIYGYCEYLHNLPERKGRKIWMTARDMYLFEKVYRMLYPEDDCEYIYLSRKSLRAAYTNAVGDLTKAGEAFPDKYYTLTQIIQYMGYLPEEVGIIQNKENNKYYGRSLGEYPVIRKALSSPKIKKKEEILAALGREYLAEHGLFSENILLADVGWHGTIQLLLEKIRDKIGKTDTIFGCYVGCCEGTRKRIGRKYKTWLFDEHDNCPFMRGILLFESMILAPHGSTIGYKKIKEGVVIPILGKSDTIPKTVIEMQQGAMRFIEDYKDSYLKNVISISPQFIREGFEQLETKPHKEELEYIGDLDYENYYTTKIASPKPLRHYFFHGKELKNDFMNAGWRTGFLYRLFKVRFPYAKLYDLGRWVWKINNYMRILKK